MRNPYTQSWKSLEDFPIALDEDTKRLMQEMLQDFQIEVIKEANIVRWGVQGDGNFRVNLVVVGRGREAQTTMG